MGQRIPAVFHFLIIAMFGAAIGHQSFALGPIGGLKSPDISCGAAKRIALWSVERHGGRAHPPIATAEFQLKVAQSLLDRMDPKRSLLLEQEALSLTEALKANWSAFMGQGECEAIRHKILVTLEVATRRYLSLIPSLSTTAPKTFSKPDSIQWVEWTVHKTRPKSLSELRTRLEQNSSHAMKSLSRSEFRAHSNRVQSYVEQLVREVVLPEPVFQPVAGLLKSFLAGLDTHSTFFDAAEFEEFSRELSGEVSGIGVRVRLIPQGLLVRGVLPATPAARSKKIRAGDWILEVNGRKLLAMNEKEKDQALLGPENSRVDVTIQRGDRREVVHLRRARFEMEEGKISHVILRADAEQDLAIIRIPSFYGESANSPRVQSRSCAADVQAIVEQLARRSRKTGTVVLDFRGNPGGYLEEAVAMAGVFIGNRPVVSVVQNHESKVLRSHAEAPLFQGNVVVVLDRESASAAEVFAGAIQDNGRGTVITEERSFGKGSVQKILPLLSAGDELELNSTERKGVVKLTTSLFYSPSGTTPEGKGVLGTVVVKAGKASREKMRKDLLKSDLVEEAETGTFKENALALELNRAWRQAGVDTEVSPGILEALSMANSLQQHPLQRGPMISKASRLQEGVQK